MGRRFFFQPYQRSFVKPLRTARGTWAVRAGFIVRVEAASGVGYGEVAPIPEFGTETVEAAGAFLQRLADAPELAGDVDALATLPCCAFGVSSALASFREDSAPSRDYKVAALLPAGRAALSVASEKVLQGYETFKWKIGVEPVEAEQAIFGELATRLPEGARLRLDANGGLSVECLESWLSFLQAHRGRVDYLEQPLAVGEEAVMARCSEASGIPIALDESLHGADGLRWLEARAWPGPLVVKPALAGDDRRLIERLRPVARQVVLSSVFETQVGLENALHLADQLPGLNRVIGFDTLDAFADSLCILHSTSTIRSAERGVFSPETLWQQLLHST